MKNTTNNVRSLLRNVLTPATIACMLIAAVPSNAHATEKSSTSSTIETPLEVKYLGKLDYLPVYQINFDNLKEEDLYITLRDEDGSLLYSDSFKGKRFSKKFQFNVPDADNMKVTLSLTSKKDRKTQVLQFNNVTKTYEDVVVTKIN